MDTNTITIAICNFNTTKLTNDAIDSIINNSGLSNIKIIILDNSDHIPFKSKYDFIKIIDNTKGRFIDFNKILQKFAKYGMKENGNASLKHCYSIDWLLKICQTKYMLLFDSDIILNRKIDFVDDKFITVAALEKYKKMNWCNEKIYGANTRFLPFIQMFNVEQIRQLSLKYFDAMRIYGGLCENANRYDTGASFYEDVVNKKINFKEIDFNLYINHFGHGSWKK